MVEIFGLDLTEWESRGYWDSAYTPFSFFDGRKVVSNVCVYSLDAVVKGRTTRLAQISAVGTLPEWRRRGLSKQLTEIALSWARERHDGVFLFADSEAIPLYEACGFRAMDEHVELVTARPLSRTGRLVKLDPGDEHHLARIYDYARRRTAISNLLGVLSAKLLVFHALHSLRNHVYEIPDLDCIVLFTRERGSLKILDIVGETVPQLDDLYPYVADESDRTIELHFHGDKLELEDAERRPLHGNNPFVVDPFPVENPIFPFTSRA